MSIGHLKSKHWLHLYVTPPKKTFVFNKLLKKMTSNKKRESVHSHLYFRIWIEDMWSHGWNAVTYGQIYSRYGRWSDYCETSYREKTEKER